jgi:L-ascorbate metabolism protein UlaG (beta-lactamase superfamily)
MKLTKFAHSCVLLEDGDKAVLLDPGSFSWDKVDVDSLPALRAVVVTHKHPDHMAEPFVRALVARFPDVQWIAPPDAHEELKSYGVQKVSDQSSGDVVVTVGKHAPVEPFGNQVQNLQVHWNNMVTSPGDSHDIPETRAVLLLPSTAPWGTTIHAIEVATALKPQYIVPIHDSLLDAQWRGYVNDRLEAVFKDRDITFLKPVDGQPIDIQV